MDRFNPDVTSQLVVPTHLREKYLHTKKQTFTHTLLCLCCRLNSSLKSCWGITLKPRETYIYTALGQTNLIKIFFTSQLWRKTYVDLLPEASCQVFFCFYSHLQSPGGRVLTCSAFRCQIEEQKHLH